MAIHHHQRRHRNLLQGLGSEGRAADRLPPWLAAQRRRLGSQMMFFLNQGFRVVAHDRRGHGRSTQTDSGNDMDTYVDDVKRAGARSSTSRTPSTSAIRPAAARSPIMSRAPSPAASQRPYSSAPCRRSCSRPKRTRGHAHRGVRRLIAPALAAIAPRSTSISRPGPSTDSTGPARFRSEGIIRNWWRQAMMGGIKAQYDCIKAFSETDFSDDLAVDHGAGAGDARR